MKLSFILLIALLQCELAFSLPMIETDNPAAQKTTTKDSKSRYYRKEVPYYYTDIKNSSLNLTLYSGSKYKIEVEKWLTEDMVSSTIISFGSFRINKDKSYSFTDFPTGIEFSAYKSGDSLKFSKGFTLMHGGSTIDDYEDCDFYQQLHLKSLANTQKNEQRDSCPDVNCGEYFNVIFGLYPEDPTPSVMLNLKPDRLYEFYIFDVLISSGQWRQHDAEITLSDSCFNKELKLIVGKEYIICSFMPGLLIGTKLYLKEPVKTHSYKQPTPVRRSRALVPIGLIVLLSLGALIVIRQKRKTK